MYSGEFSQSVFIKCHLCLVVACSKFRNTDSTDMTVAVHFDAIFWLDMKTTNHPSFTVNFEIYR